MQSKKYTSTKIGSLSNFFLILTEIPNHKSIIYASMLIVGKLKTRSSKFN